VLTAGDDGLARIWGISIDEPGATTLSAGFDLEDREGRLTSAAFSPDGKRILTAGSDGLARLWDGRTGAALADLDGHVAQINSAAFSPDGARVATAASDGAVRIWDVSTTPPGEPIALNAHGESTYQADFSPDGSLLVTTGCDEQNDPCQAASARVWDTETGELLIEWFIDQAGITSASLSPDGQHLLTIGDDGLVQLMRIYLDAEAMRDGADDRLNRG
ncbi:MAG: PD40 domain-containing protein, partial [Chloroflexota bacterium]